MASEFTTTNLPVAMTDNTTLPPLPPLLPVNANITESALDLPPVAEGVSEGSTANNSNKDNNKLPPQSSACVDNDVADHPGPSETKSKDSSTLIEGVAIGDADKAVVEDGGEENNSTKMAPLDD